MPQLAKATLQEIKADKDGTPVGDPIPVQFNPTSLKLQITNQSEGAQSRGRQKRQYTGSSSTTLTLELVFDTADEGTTEAPVSVRDKTREVERFALPQGTENEKQAPPKVRFHWGNLIVDGLIESVTVDLDLFAADGTPLRAKVSCSIKEQDSRYQYGESGPGANEAANPPAAGGAAPGAPGSLQPPAPNRSIAALAGETAAELAARVGLDPGAWRGLSVDLSAGFELSAGLEVGFQAGASLSAGIGVSAGVKAGVGLDASASLKAAAGLEPQQGATTPFGGGSQTEAGFRLAAAGGVGQALESVRAAKNEASVAQAREAFRPPAALASAAPSRPAASAGAPDPRVRGFGFGVPLRPRLPGAAEARTASLTGRAPVGARTSGSGAPTTADPTVPGWVSLPRSGSAAAPTRHPASCRCGCGKGGKR